ncbi:alpha/beta fold hydrolase [Gilvimarinus sp. F26214L]|uniref:alpha/beta fold hydrolase n=1 Tax=Gilvimarinus sp. DZF01 TaxID=3461371 RepID=UPI00404670A3
MAVFQRIASILVLSAFAMTALAEEPPREPPSDWGPISSTFEEVPYPHPVQYLDLQIFGEDVRLAYMDVKPQGRGNGQSVMLFHGMNFAGLGFEPTIKALSEAGFRVIVPDRIGYGRSSKPDIPYNLHVFASNAKALLDHLKIENVAIVGHSMGGMLASRFAMTYGDITTHVAFVNQIGMSDPRQSRPWRDMEAAYQSVLKNTTYQSILRNHMRYYPTWDNKYLHWVKLQYGQTLTSEWPKLARIRAWQQQILYFDPVVYDWQHIDTKALVIGGAADGLAADFGASARKVAEALPNAELVLFEGIGHNPHFEIPEKFHGELVRFLKSDPGEPASDDWK